MSTPPDAKTTARCPYIGIDANNHRLGEAIEYPSFENRCWTTARPIPLLLTDQATLCLCNGYQNCPRFIATRAARHGQERPANIPPPVDSDSITSALKELEADVQTATASQSKSRRRWGWIGAGLIFMSSLLCGGFFAAYMGWQMVRDELATVPPGNIDTLATSAQAAAQPQTFIIQTATSAPQPVIVAQVPNPGNEQAAGIGTTGNAPSYPVAVLPTAAPADQVPQQPPPSLSEIAQETNDTPLQPVVSSTPILDFQLEIPTRRPTPVLDIPTSTPSVQETPTLQPTPTPIPPQGTPVVIFYAENEEMQPGDCTDVHWHVENVKAVYYENQGVDGQGQKEECIRDDDPGDYNLMVIMANGATQIYTVTVGVVIPTNTPEATPSRTPEPPPTPTWTPNVPTDTPTPPTRFGARLEAGGDTKITCARGETCDVDFYVVNTGSAIDSISVRFTEAASWPRQLCRLDSVCHESQMTLVNMGISNTGVIRLSVTVPDDASNETMTYRIQGVSEQSGGTAVSNIITVEVKAQDGSSN